MNARILILSDAAARGERKDLSGPALRDALDAAGWTVASIEILPDDLLTIQRTLKALSDGGECDLIVTTGGTGVGPRDVTPEATVAVCERLLSGVAERMRSEGTKKTKFAALSRGVCGIRGRALILNLPGSPSGAVESLEAVAGLIPHALDLLSGKTEHR